MLENLLENVLLVAGMIAFYIALNILDKLIGIIKKFVIIAIVFLIFLPEPTKEFFQYTLGISL